MEIIKTPIEDLIIIKPRVFEDARGFFFESYSELKFNEAGINIKFCQDNQSKSGYGVIRGLHYQLQPHSRRQTSTFAVLDRTQGVRDRHERPARRQPPAGFHAHDARHRV